ncbi:unnamed protein product [Spirodela intermedia]|uniref:Protein Iojap, chloroplastic n=1 Tax=Spirodela intermedia TaxID=51605 RepID=A0A7I8LBT0_SPIIN|nr:unnamed protein product [Spirodela intermedia]
MGFRPLRAQRGAGNVILLIALHTTFTPQGKRSDLFIDFPSVDLNFNVNEDMDETLDELLDNYGKVVYRRGDTTPIAEVNDDAESLSFAIALAKVANDVKAGDIRVLFVKPLVYWTRFFIIATAFSRPQIDAIGSRIRDLAEQQFKRVVIAGDVVVHIFLPQQRAFYNLEEFYGNATAIDVPFDQPPPFRQ